jgi:hypothetical protein
VGLGPGARVQVAVAVDVAVAVEVAGVLSPGIQPVWDETREMMKRESRLMSTCFIACLLLSVRVHAV